MENNSFSVRVGCVTPVDSAYRRLATHVPRRTRMNMANAQPAMDRGKPCLSLRTPLIVSPAPEKVGMEVKKSNAAAESAGSLKDAEQMIRALWWHCPPCCTSEVRQTLDSGDQRKAPPDDPLHSPRGSRAPVEKRCPRKTRLTGLNAVDEAERKATREKPAGIHGEVLHVLKIEAEQERIIHHERPRGVRGPDREESSRRKE
jgi:hypothetical protein